MPAVNTTAGFLAKLAFTAIGMSILLMGFWLRVRAAGSWTSSEVLNPELDRLGDWLVAVGAVWLAFSFLMWLLAPRAWNVLAQFLMVIVITTAILGNLVVAAVFEILDLPEISTSGGGLGWRVALAIGCTAIVIAQLAVASALKEHHEEVQSGAVTRLRLSAVLVLILGGFAAWTLPVPFVAALALSALVYIAIELFPR